MMKKKFEYLTGREVAFNLKLKKPFRGSSILGLFFFYIKNLMLGVMLMEHAPFVLQSFLSQLLPVIAML